MGLPFTLAQKNAPNPWLRRIGRNTSLVSPITFHGLGVLGAMNPSRASVFPDYDNGYYDEELGEYIIPDGEGYATCLTEVVPWPFAEDDAGIAFDQANLWGVRTRVWRLPDSEGGGDKDWWTAVPKNPGEDYTSVGRCGLMENAALIQDFLGDDPMIGFQWNHRTPNGLLLDTTTAEGLARSLWTPMNLNQQVLEVELGNIFTGQWVYYGPDESYDSDETMWVAALLANGHIGFRGGTLVFTIFSTYAGEVPVSGSFEYEIIAVPVTEFWDPFDADGTESVVEILTTGTVSWSFSSFADPPVVVEHTLGDMRPANPGIPCNFYLRYAYDNTFAAEVPVPLYGSNHQLQLSPRTDVPLPYFASQRDRVAGGGIILP